MRSFQEIINEKELTDLLGLKKGNLRELCKKGLPFVQLSKGHRVYLVNDVIEWLEKRTERRTETG